MNFRTILAMSDFSTQAEEALERAALLASQHGALLRLMYFPESPGDIAVGALARLALRGRQLARRHGVEVEVLHSNFYALDGVISQAARADLLVLHRRAKRHWTDWLRGSLDQQILRRAQCPVLFVGREAAGRYRRVLVAVDFSPESRKLVQIACGVDPDSDIEVFHAIHSISERRLRAADVSIEAIQAWRRELLRHAQHRMVQMTDSLDARRNRVRSVLGQGDDPARQVAVQQAASGAGLVVVGRNRRAPLADFLLGNVSQRLLRLADSDVLVVPHDHAMFSRVSAITRLQRRSVA